MKSRAGSIVFLLGLGILGGFGCNQAPASPPVVVNTVPPATHTITHNYHTTRVVEKVKTVPAPSSSTTTTHTTIVPPDGTIPGGTSTSTTTTNPASGTSSTTTTDPDSGSSTTTTTVH